MEIAMMDHEDSKEANCIMEATDQEANWYQEMEQQGRPQLRLQKSYQFQVPKTNPKLAPCTCLSWS